MRPTASGTSLYSITLFFQTYPLSKIAAPTDPEFWEVPVTGSPEGFSDEGLGSSVNVPFASVGADLLVPITHHMLSDPCHFSTVQDCDDLNTGQQPKEHLWAPQSQMSGQYRHFYYLTRRKVYIHTRKQKYHSQIWQSHNCCVGKQHKDHMTHITLWI